MKISIKLSADEAEGLKNYHSFIFKNEEANKMSMDEFVRVIFFNGIEFMNNKLNNAALEIINNKELRQELEASGFNIQAIEDKLAQ